MKTILLAEDDADDREVFTDIFHELGYASYKLVCVENGFQVIEYLKGIKTDEELPVLLILDQNMPRMTGKETVHHLQGSDRYKDIPTIIYSTYHDSKFISDSQAMNIRLFLKPDSYDLFKLMISEMIGYIRQSELKNNK